ncbi:MAG: tRNA uridine-5-carboxymethylaminomethyl(34) synthesis GTPase MnmE [Bacilli bacterium]|nr:tRNA uridine-5-carboxymethylaminomethyl(34) synthesis GTPase MnmE [Bacilli bacterium]
MEGCTMNETICAISTALGVGAISIIRISGEKSIEIVNSIFKGKDLTKVNSHTIHYGYIIYKNEIIDEVLISIMKGPKTFTTEDIVEINCHGGISTTNKILEILLTNGCKLAEPGEFTKRAFLNGRISLLEAESVSDLINSETEKSRTLSINGVTGNISNMIKNIKDKLLPISANIEVNIDYPEYEDAILLTNKLIKPVVEEVKQDLEKLLQESKNGKIIKNGIDVAIVGKPNVGKSSLLNAFLEEEKAIVTNIAGTTRDIVEGKYNLDGIILNLIDTAGIRETEDVVEKIGVNKSKEIIEKSDLVIFVLNYNESLTEEEINLIKELENKNMIVYINKNDLDKQIEVELINNKNIVYGNTKNISNLEELKNKIKEIFNLEQIDTKNMNYLSNSRQISLVNRAILALDNCLEQIENNVEIDLLAIDIKECYDLLSEIIGEAYNDELLDEIFANFCLGK